MEILSHVQAELIERIGMDEGRNSAVWRALDPQLGGEIAVKELPIESLEQSPADYLSEAQRLYQARHSHVVPINYAAIEGNALRVAMPYFIRGSVQTFYQGKPLTIRETVRIATDFLSGLYHVHATGLIHLDVKPSNLLVHISGNVLLSDFGQSRQVDELGTSEVPKMYNRHYPPEALRYDRLTRQADIYQAGLTLFRLLNGEYIWDNIFERTTAQGNLRTAIEDGSFVKPSDFLPHIPTGLKLIVRKAINVDPARRYQTATELRNALSRLNRCLDWKVTEITASFIQWERSTNTHTQIVRMWQNSSKQWQCESHSVRLRDQMQRSHHAWSLTSPRRGDVVRHLRGRFGES